MTNIIIMIAAVVMTITNIIMSIKIGGFDWDEYNKKMDELDRELDRNEMNVARCEGEINSIIERMDNVANDIKRIDSEHTTDHRNLVDIRKRYVLYRDPTQEENNG